MASGVRLRRGLFRCGQHAETNGRNARAVAQIENLEYPFVGDAFVRSQDRCIAEIQLDHLGQHLPRRGIVEFAMVDRDPSISDECSRRSVCVRPRPAERSRKRGIEWRAA